MRTLCGCLLALLAAGCVDLGYDVPLLGRPPGPAGGGDAGGDCVEGEVAPTADGPQVQFITLDVNIRELRVAAGDTVTWTNTDTMPHSVNAGAPGAEVPAASGGFASAALPPGGQFAYRFCSARSVFYFCAVHPGQMTGYRVVIE